MVKVQNQRGPAATRSDPQERELTVLRMFDAAPTSPSAVGDASRATRMLGLKTTTFDFQSVFNLFDQDLWNFIEVGGTTNDRNSTDGDVLQLIGKGSMTGLAHMHSLKVLHRDLRARNIFISQRGPRARAVLGGLG